jgi:hypothetical protein
MIIYILILTTSDILGVSSNEKKRDAKRVTNDEKNQSFFTKMYDKSIVKNDMRS